MIHHPERNFGDASRELTDLDTVELAYIYPNQVLYVQGKLRRRVEFAQYLQLQSTQLPIGYN